MPFPEHPIDIRADIYYNEEMMVYHLNYWKKAIITTDKPLPIQMLKNFKSHISAVTYEIKDDDDSEFVKQVVELGISLALISYLPEESLQKKKIKYYEFGLINKIKEPDLETIKLLKSNLETLCYRSCKVIAANGKIYSSHANRVADIFQQSDFEYKKAIDSPLLWKDLDFCTFAIQ